MSDNSKPKITALRDLTESSGSVAVEGVVFNCDFHESRKPGLWVEFIEMTDYTSSISVRRIIEEDEAQELAGMIEPGVWIRVEGEVEPTYDGEDIQINPHNIEEIDHEERFDDADESRVELHLHTNMSKLDGLTRPASIVSQAMMWGMPALAVTDHASVQAFPDMNKYGNRLDLKILYGYEGNLSDGSERVNSVMLIAQNRVGLKNLYQIVSASFLRHFMDVPLVMKDELAEHRDGLLVGAPLTRGELTEAIVKGEAWEHLKQIAVAYDYLEIEPIDCCRHQFGNDEKAKEAIRAIIKLGEELGKPVCAVGNVHFQDPEDEDYRKILLSHQKSPDADKPLPLFFRTTREMLGAFSFLGEDKAYEVVVTNTRLIAKMVEQMNILPQGKLFPPYLEGAAAELNRIVRAKAEALYGTPLPDLVSSALDTELLYVEPYADVFMANQKLVQRSLENGYLVGTRGMVASSFVAYLAGITEINPLPPHYRCPKCGKVEFVTGTDVDCGVDLPDKACEDCGAVYEKDGFNLVPETFFGLNGGKQPDIDLNFSGDYQLQAQKHLAELFGADHVFRAGTIGTVSEKLAYSMVDEYLQERGLQPRRAEVDRLANGCIGVMRTTGQHPGGLVVVPSDFDIEDFCPVQHPAFDNDTITTHFEYHYMEDNLFKFDILGHDDPTMLRMLADLTGVDPRAIPLDDPDTMSLFASTKVLGYEDDEVIGPIGTLAVNEFTTRFVRQMLIDTQPRCFRDLVRISGLSHGTDVWLGNAKNLILSGTASLSEIAACRDDIFIYLIRHGLDRTTSFKIMEATRKGKVKRFGFPDGCFEEMEKHGVPAWYYESLGKIGYLFPKSHATNYVMLAFRIAWFKVHHPLAFYAAYFAVRARTFDPDAWCFADAEEGRYRTKHLLSEIENEPAFSEECDDMLRELEVCYEFYLRGYHFEVGQIKDKRDLRFQIVDNGLLVSSAE